MSDTAAVPVSLSTRTALPALRVLQVRDARMTCEGVVQVRSSSDCEVVTVTTVREACGLAKAARFDVILSADWSDRIDPIAAVEALVEASAAPVVAVICEPGPMLVRDLLDAGASGVLSRWTDRDDVCKLLRLAADGETVFDPLTASKTVGSMRSSPAELTERELAVLGCVIDGLSNNEIAERLFLSRSTVAMHLARLSAKLGATCRVTAAVAGLRHGLVP
jgi:DNA-binding NarL/FixJ family response regulator